VCGFYLDSPALPQGLDDQNMAFEFLRLWVTKISELKWHLSFCPFSFHFASPISCLESCDQEVPRAFVDKSYEAIYTPGSARDSILKLHPLSYNGDPVVGWQNPGFHCNSEVASGE
jgi:hypothetical protein